MNKVFVSQPLNLRGGGSNPLGPLGPLGPPRPLGYFGLPMLDPCIPPLPPNRPHRRPLNYFWYVKDFDPNADVNVFKAAIRVNNEIDDAKIVNMFNLTLKYIMSNWCNNYMGNYPDYIFVELQLIF